MYHPMTATLQQRCFACRPLSSQVRHGGADDQAHDRGADAAQGAPRTFAGACILILSELEFPIHKLLDSHTSELSRLWMSLDECDGHCLRRSFSRDKGACRTRPNDAHSSLRLIFLCLFFFFSLVVVPRFRTLARSRAGRPRPSCCRRPSGRSRSGSCWWRCTTD